MPKAQNSSQNTSNARIKQITDFFSCKSASQVNSPSGTRSKNTKHSATKENTALHVYNTHTKLQVDSGISSSSGVSSASINSPISVKAVSQITSLTQPPTKRLRSQSIGAGQSANQAKRRDILCESTSTEDAMDVDENSGAYIPAVILPLEQRSPSCQLPSPDMRETMPLDRNSEISFVPSSVSDEQELDSIYSAPKDVSSVKEAIDHWRQETLSLSPLIGTNRPIEVGTQTQSIVQPHIDADWIIGIHSASSATPSCHSAGAITNVFIPTPPSMGGSEGAFQLSPIKLLDEKAKTDQIIAEIRARAFARSRSQVPSSPVDEISSIDSSDDEDDEYGSLAVLGYCTGMRSSSRIKAKNPAKPARYNLREHVPVKAQFESKISSRRDASPSLPARQKSCKNPLDAFLREKRTVDSRNSVTSVDREARLRELADIHLDDYDKDDVLTNTSFSGPIFGADDKDPFLDDDRKREVMDILEGDKSIEDEEERTRRQETVGMALWDTQEQGTMDDLEGALSSIEYEGSDPTLQTFAETIAHRDYHLLCLFMQSGVLETADYREGGNKIIDYLITLGLSFRQDDLDLFALQLLPPILSNDSVTSLVPLVDHVLSVLVVFGARQSVLATLGWTGYNAQCRNVSHLSRFEAIQRIVFCITNVAKSSRLPWEEIPDLIIILLLVGLEPSVSQEMRLQVSRSIHAVCQSLGQENVVETDVECAIVNRVLHLVQSYNVQAKLHVVNLISNGAGRAARIARSVAHAMLTDKSTLFPSQYSALPPISELLDVLDVSSSSAPRPPGKFEYHEEADYTDMACWTSLLAIAITDIASYMEIEEMTKKSTGKLSQTHFKGESIFETLYRRLKRMHDRIQDNRAVRLDRSKTKTILNHTIYRILYQYRAIVQYRKKNFGKIQNYMSRK